MATGFISPIGLILQAFSDQGVVGAGYKINTYVAGSSTPVITYTDSSLTVQNSNPIVLQSNGRFNNVSVWAPASTVIKMVITDPAGVVISGGTIDNLPLINDISTPQTPAEIAATVVPTAPQYPEFYARRYGAPIDGLNSANAALVQADAVATAAAFGAIIFTNGQYLISSNLTITNDLWFEPGAHLVVANGVTLRLLGGINAPPQQIFSLVGTGTVAFGNTTTNQRWGVAKPIVCPEYWGARGLQGPNAATTGDTVAVQACFDSHREFLFYQHYPVTQVILSGNETTGDFGGFELRGIATVATKSVLDLKCGYSSIRRIQVSAEFNALYECAIHWYTNDLNIYYPGFNRFYGFWPRNALIGLCIGALPSQADPIPAQGTVNAAGIASNAPLSESTIEQFNDVDCVIGVYYRQPNGKITINGNITGSAANWTGKFGSSGYTAASTCALFLGHEGNELSQLGGSLENVFNQTGLLMNIQGGTYNQVGVTVESVAPSFISGESRVNICTSNDFGFNFPIPYQAFTIDKDATGQLVIVGCSIQYPVTSLSSFAHPLCQGVNGVGGAATPNYGKFQLKLDNCELRDVPQVQGTTGYAPISQGVDLLQTNNTLVSYSGGGVRSLSYYLSDDTGNLLAGQVDTSNQIITAYGLNGNAASGGWTFTVTNAGTCNWGSTASGITYLGKTIDKSLRLQAPAAETTTATSPKFPCQAEKTYLLRGFIKTGTTAATIFIRALWWKWDSTAASTAQTDLLVVAENILGATQQQLLLMLTPPKDAVKMSIFLSAANGSTLYTTDLNIT